MTRFTLIKGKDERPVSFAAEPFDRSGWRLLCHVDRPCFRKLSLFSRQESGKTIYAVLDVDPSIDKYMAMDYYRNYVEKLEGIADVSFADAFPKSKKVSEKVYIKRQLSERAYLEIRNAEDDFDGFTVASFRDGVRNTIRSYETLAAATEAADDFELGYRAAGR